MTNIHTRWSKDDPDGAQEVFTCPTSTGQVCDKSAPHSGQLIGWIERGRPMVTVKNGQTITWDEWGFIPRYGKPSEVRRNRLAAREDARRYAQTLAGA